MARPRTRIFKSVKAMAKAGEMDEDVEILMDPRQKTMWESYIGIKSETRGNAYRSALKAGYSNSYSVTITNRRFFKEKIRRLNMLSKAEKILDKTLSLKVKDENGKVQSDILRIQTDVAKHITKTLGKEEGYSERNEVTGKDGTDIAIASIVFNPPTMISQPSDGV